MEQFNFVVTLLAALGTGLLAGNFFAFSAYLMRALTGLSAERGIVAMQAITAAIKSIPFLILFFGTAVLCAVLFSTAILAWGKPDAYYRLAGTLFFLLGTFPVTMMANRPLNNRLAIASPDTQEGRELWKRIQSSWAAWNHVRTVTALAACALLILALAASGNPFAH
ncbi:MAG TPA: anthrone oxygenase family protein [Methyloceanibacter sp.]|nr:anthrone oxygenase family protein [Methyloceanibacter sp.]